MSGFAAMAAYHPRSILIVGLLTFLGFLGLGTWLVGRLRLSLPTPWRELAGLFLGIQVVSLVVQLTAMAGLVSRTTLIGIWIVVAAAGGLTAAAGVRLLPGLSIRTLPGWTQLLLGLLAAALLANLLVAVAPSSKIDEIYYHMLLPARIAGDGALRFYRLPWEGAMLPQMIVPIALTPLHALGFPDGGNVVSWGVGVTLLWFIGRLLFDAHRSPTWAALWPAAFAVGLYPAVWWVTSGSHAVMDAASAAVVVACFRRQLLLDRIGPVPFAALLSLLLVTASTAKLSLLPLSLLVLAVMGAWLLRQGGNPRRLALALGLPWLTFVLPLALWTFWQSGSPFGPALSGLFPGSVYDPAAVQRIFDTTRAVSRPTLFTFLRGLAINQAPLLWLGTAAFLALDRSDRVFRLAAAAAVLIQLALIGLVLPLDLRFLGGIPYGLAVCFALNPPAWALRPAAPRWLLAGLAALAILPWLVGQGIYAARFAPVALGFQPKAEFYAQNVPFTADFAALERLLPPDAVLLDRDIRLGSIYAPRPIVMDPADLPAGRPVFFFGRGEDVVVGTEVFPGFRVEEIVYRNPAAVFQTFRTPGRPPVHDALAVARLAQAE